MPIIPITTNLPRFAFYNFTPLILHDWTMAVRKLQSSICAGPAFSYIATLFGLPSIQPCGSSIIFSNKILSAQHSEITFRFPDYRRNTYLAFATAQEFRTVNIMLLHWTTAIVLWIDTLFYDFRYLSTGKLFPVSEFSLDRNYWSRGFDKNRKDYCCISNLSCMVILKQKNRSQNAGGLSTTLSKSRCVLVLPSWYLLYSIRTHPIK